MKKTAILLADDHQIVREGLKLLINSQPDLRVIGEAGTGKEALQKARDLKPEVVVMDLTMPELNATRRPEFRLCLAAHVVRALERTRHLPDRAARRTSRIPRGRPRRAFRGSSRRRWPQSRVHKPWLPG